MLGLLVWSCNSNIQENNNNTSTKDEVYIDFVKEKRNQKNDNLIKRGVIEQDDLATFSGLKYYEPDSTYIVRANIEKVKPEQIILETTSGKPRQVFKFLKLTFNLKGENNILYAYVENITNPVDLFIPFKDKSNETETYKAGRYLDLKYQNESKLILLDFNFAYNPYCHYNHEYSCPLVPFENTLKIAIEAGEKTLYNN